ncbi:MAG: DNA polymerase III subunit beta [Candidatus Falkowbacteria bacterium]|nr:DNA polymerase III subunit beta [Candidatus Falkowbacteria bacterium]
MKLISLQKNLKNCLYSVNHIAQKNASLPILNNILITAQAGVINLITTNLELGITTTLRGKIDEDGSFTVDAKTISDYVALLNNEKIAISLVESELLLECGSYKTKIKGSSAEEFPLIPKIERTEFVKINLNDFKKALSQVAFSVSSDEARIELSGVLFSLDDKAMTIVGTDSYRLAEKKIEIENNFSQNRQLIIPVKTVQELARIISSDQGDEEVVNEVLLYASDNQCLFVVGGTEIVSRLIDGHYPDYQQIIPQKQVCSASFSKDDVIRAVKAAAIFSRAGVNDINFSFSKSGLEISSASGQTGEHQAVVEGIVTGADTSITLNYRYVLDGLAALIGTSSVFSIIDDQTPCILQDESDKNYRYIIMPIKK